MTDEFLLLQLRSLIADKEMVVEEARRELAVGDDWTRNHSEGFNHIDRQINGIILLMEFRHRREQKSCCHEWIPDPVEHPEPQERPEDIMKVICMKCGARKGRS